MKAPLVAATWLALLGLAGLPVAAMAQSPEPPDFLVEQQQRYQELKSRWTTIDLPDRVLDENTPRTAYSSGVDSVWVRLHNVDLYFAQDVGFHARDLTVRLRPNETGEPIRLDALDSFSIDILSGCVVLDEPQLEQLFDQHILDYRPRPLNDLQIDASPGELTINGGLKLWSWFPGVWLPVELDGPLTLTDDTRQLAYQPDTIRVLKLPVRGILDFTGIPLGALLSIDSEGVNLDGLELMLDVQRVFPPPRINNKPVRMAVDDNGVALCFEKDAQVELTPPDDAGDSYIWVQAGDIVAIDKLLVNANILFRPQGDGKPLDLSLSRYREHLAAGVLRMSENGALFIDIPPRRPTANAGQDDRQ